MQIVCLDSETYSETDLSAVGALNYCNHPSTELLFWTACPLGGKGEYIPQNDPREAFPVERTIALHWGPFDRFLFERLVTDRTEPTLKREWPQAIWYSDDFALLDLQQLVIQCGGPAKLQNASLWAGGPGKLSGKEGMQLFSQPDAEGKRRYPGDGFEEEWQRFIDYGIRDVEVMPLIVDHVDAVPCPDLNVGGWRVVERMNRRGFPVDRAAVEIARGHLETREPALVAECVALTGGLRPTQTQKLKDWFGTPNTQKETMQELVADESIPRDVRRVAEIRLEVAGATRHKLTPLLNHGGLDGRCRYQFTYFGAWTRRLTAQSTQPQNFVAGNPSEEFFERLEAPVYEGDIFGDVQRNIRGFIKAKPGRLLVAADFSQIELRVMAWLAGEEWLLEALAAGDDVYLKTASDIYGEPVTEKADPRRAFGKEVELACQFGLSPVGKDGTGGLKARAATKGIIISSRRAEKAVSIYRRTHKAIVDFWEAMEEATVRVIRGGEAEQVGRITIEKTMPDLVRIIRPSGHFQCLWSPKIVPGEYHDSVSYVGRNKAKMMARTQTWGSRLAQGVVQGTAADMLLEGMRTAELHGYPPIMSIHDEVVTEIKDDGDDEHANRLCEIFSNNLPSWADGVPVTAEGWQGMRFRK